mgnify:CR=1 FL=1
MNKLRDILLKLTEFDVKFILQLIVLQSVIIVASYALFVAIWFAVDLVEFLYIIHKEV